VLLPTTLFLIILVLNVLLFFIFAEKAPENSGGYAYSSYLIFLILPCLVFNGFLLV
jgi:hypothetical protein